MTPAPPPSGAPPGSAVVVAVVRDLMDRSRLNGDDLEIRFVGVDELADTVAGAGTADGTVDGAHPVDRVVIDLAVPGVLNAVAQLEDRLAQRGTARPPVIAYGPHVDRDRLAEARQAGCDQVLARSAFFARWPEVG